MKACVPGDAAAPAIPSWKDLRDRYADDASDCSDSEPAGAHPEQHAGESDGDVSSEDEQDALEAAVWAEVYEGPIFARRIFR